MFGDLILNLTLFNLRADSRISYSINDFVITKHAFFRTVERTGSINPSEEIRKLLKNCVMISKNRSITKVSNGRFTIICDFSSYPYRIITFREVNQQEQKELFFNYWENLQKNQ